MTSRQSGPEGRAYGYGWMLGGPPGLEGAVWHNGGQQGVTTVLLAFPAERRAVIVLANRGGAGGPTLALAVDIANATRVVSSASRHAN